MWSQRLEDALPPDHPVRLFDQLLHAEPFAATFREWERDYLLVEGQPPYQPRLIKLEHVTTDGTMIEADAGRGSVRSAEKIRSWLGHVDEKMAALEAEWTANEDREASLFGDDACWARPRGVVPCAACPRAELCCRDSAKGRRIERDQ